MHDVIERPQRRLLDSIANRIRSLDVLAVCYLAMFAPIFLTNSYTAAHKLYLWAVLPAALLPFLLDRNRWRELPPLTVLFISACLYMLALDFSSWSNEASSHDVRSQIARSLQIASFLLITALLVVSYPSFVSRALTAVSAFAALSAAINIGAHIATKPWADRLYGVIGMPDYHNATNISATYAILCIAATATLLTAKRAGHIAVLCASSATLLVAVLMTQSRGALVGVAAGLCTLALLGGRAVRLGLLAVAVVAAVLLAIPSVQQHIVSRGANSRVELWSAYIDKAAERPLLGYGAVKDFGVKMPNGLLIENPHNLVLSAQIHGGLVAALSMLAILLGGVYWTWRYYHRTQNAAPLAAFVTMAACGLFDYNLLLTRPDWPWVTFWLPIALAIGAEAYVRREPHSPGC